MAHVLSCPRCLQSRSVSAIVPGQTCFCPFCRLEFEPRWLPAREQPARPTPHTSKARRWPLLVAAVAVLLLPVGAVVLLALRGERASESEWKNLPDTARRDKVYLNANEATKPALVVSSVTEAPEVVVNREISPPPPLPAPPPAPVLTEAVAMPREVVKAKSIVTNVSKPARKTPTPWPVRVDQLDAEIRIAELEQELKEALGPAISRVPSCARRAETEIELRTALAKAPEVDLDSKNSKDQDNAHKIRMAAKQDDATNPHPLLPLARSRADLKGLPFLGESDCQLSKRDAEVLSKESQEVRTIVAMAVASDKKDKTKFFGALDQLPAATLNQIVMAAEADIRLRAIMALARNNRPSTTAALANRAVFDLDEENRLMAVRALRQREPADYVPVLLKAFRYPWPVAAQNAAFALSTLKAKGAAPLLVDLLDKPDPRAPFETNKGEWPMVREVVRVNHLRNCMLCHAAQTVTSGDEFRNQVPGLVPPRDREVRPFSAIYYAGNNKGDFVRADITYLEQDFSAALPVEDCGKWPHEQRYDFFVRTRPATVWERVLPPNKNYPQRTAALTALRELTQLDCGDDATAWRKALKFPEL